MYYNELVTCRTCSPFY